MELSITMKKWLVGYIILSLILLGIITFIGADKSSINTKYSNVYKESETIVQSAQNYYGSYLLISTNNDEKVVKVDKDRENYQILDMVVNGENLFFMYEYTPHLNEPIYGLGCYNLKSEKLHSYSISNLDAYTWLAFGVRDGKMYCLMNDIDNKEVVEFIVNDVSDADWEISQTFKYPDGHYVIKAGYVGGNVSIYLDDGSTYYYKDMKLCEYDNIAGTSFDEYKVGLLNENFNSVWMIKCIINTLATIIVVWLVITVIGAFVVVGIVGRNKLTLRMFSIVELVFTLTIIASSIVFAINTYNDSQNRVYDASEAGLIKLVGKAETVQSISYEMLYETSENGNCPYADIMVIKKDKAGATVINALVSPKKAADAALLKVIDRGNTYKDVHRSEISFNGKVYLITTVYKEGLSSDTILVGFTDKTIITSQLEQFIERLYMVSGIIWICGSLIIVVVYIVYTVKWKRFSNALISIVRNRDDIIIPTKFKGGMQREWSAIEQIRHKLSKSYYEKIQNMEQYSKYVPKGIESVLDKQTLLDVEVGDFKEFEGNVVTISVENADFDNTDKYLKTASKNYEIVYDAIKDKQGTIISQDSDLSECKLIFKDSVNDALKFSVEVLRRMRENPGIADREKLIVVNSTTCKAGIIGCEEKAVPFLHYAEEEVFIKYIDSLKRAGVHLIITEKAINQCSEKFTFRYIGYISDKGINIKIHECLDAYPKFKKEIIEKTAKKFKQAIGLFYSGDFYLARNAFNEVLKANPDDLIAKWYLFNCEHNLNNTAEEQVNYSLFGNKIYEQQYRI